MRERDSQRRKLYTAENAAFKNFKSRDVSTHSKYVARLDAILNSKWLRERYPNTPRKVTVEVVPQRRGASAWSYTIETGPKAMVEWILVHELAHIVHKHSHPDGSKQPGHGREYAEVYVRLVRRFLGADAYKRLREEFRRHKVKVGRRRAPATPVNNIRFIRAWQSKQTGDKA